MKISNIKFSKIDIYRDESNLLKVHLFTEDRISVALNEGEVKTYNLEIKIKFKTPLRFWFDAITINNADYLNESCSYIKDIVETVYRSQKVVYYSEGEPIILKEWYGCYNNLYYHNGFSTFKSKEETITYRDGTRISYVIKNGSESAQRNCFWIKLKDYKFKVSYIKSSNSEGKYNRFVLEYRTAWGTIPTEDERYDISCFLSFIFGSKPIKFGETFFNDEYLTQKEYNSISPLDTSLLYQWNEPFFFVDYRHNDTDYVIKQIPKLMRKYFSLKEKYRLNEVFATLYIKSYLNFNFINYVTYIEMFANIDVEKNYTLISKSRFRKILKELNQVKKVPKVIQDKFQTLNKIGIGKKVQKLLSKSKIDYNRYNEVFKIRGKVVHGEDVDLQEMYMASVKAKELLTILTLKKLGYSGFIRDFTNNDKLILLKDMSEIGVCSINKKQI